MSEWKRRRFWTEAATVPEAGGHGVRLDGRPLRTPGRLPLVLPTLALARGVAAEWQAQEGDVRPETMPLTRMANSAIEKVTPKRAEVAEMLAAYGGSDLLCYRAEGPADLVRLQRDWDGPLDWAAQRYGARLMATEGVMPLPQDPGALARLAAAVDALDPFELTGFHDLVSLTGSLVLALAVADGALPLDEAWRLSRLDEEWQAGVWGRDDEADAAAEVKRLALGDAKNFLDLVRTPD